MEELLRRKTLQSFVGSDESTLELFVGQELGLEFHAMQKLSFMRFGYLLELSGT